MDIETKPWVLVVEDDTFMQDFICETLVLHCQPLKANSGLEGLALAREHQPNLVIADVQMPDMDGYELCRQMKQDPSLAEIPVLFLSALSGIDDWLLGFEVGGEDFISKPVNPKLLQAKVYHALSLIEQRQQLQSQAQYASSTAMMVMTSMSETGLVLEGIKKFNLCTNHIELAQAVKDALLLFELKAVVELLLPDNHNYAVNAHGPASKLELSIIRHMASEARISQLKNRLSICYPHVRVLISNMPLNDPERCGRLRDHLAMLVEAAEVRLDALNTANQALQRGGLIAKTIQSLSVILANIDQLQRQGRTSAYVQLSDQIMKLETTLTHLELSEQQEARVTALTQGSLEVISNTLQNEANAQDQLTQAIAALHTTLDQLGEQN